MSPIERYRLASYIKGFLDLATVEHEDYLEPVECKLIWVKFRSRYPDYERLDYDLRTSVRHEFDYNDMGIHEFRPYRTKFTAAMIEEMFQALEQRYLQVPKDKTGGKRRKNKKAKKVVWPWVG